jgi:8-oxo-dGTP pyrophosphatase MutT (NUDIX family)
VTAGEPERRLAPIHPAATVILLRDGVDGIETWLLRRRQQMAFAPSMSVFPGGRVDDGDASADVPWIGAEPREDAERFECSVELARAALVAAVRETFEETGVLITNPPFTAREPAPIAGYENIGELRRAIEDGYVEFARVLIDAGLSVDAGLIRPWSHWITPPNEVRRYDTFFYVAVLPEGAEALADSVEATAAGWIRPEEALAEHGRGERPMLPPTLVQLADLRSFATAAEVLAASPGRALAAVRPQFRRTGDGTGVLVMSDGFEVATIARSPKRDRAALPDG